ncbi:MAG: glycosyltransferase family 4 protein [Thermoplasmata archaeon]
MKKKVCIIHKVEALDPRSFYKQATSLSSVGYDVTILGLFRNTRNLHGVRIIGFKPPNNRFTRFAKTNYQIFRRALREKADVYHFHDLDFIPWAILLKIFTKSKIVYDIHEAYPEYMLLKTYIPKPFKKIIAFFIYLIEHGAIKIFDAIIPNDNFISKEFIHKKNIVIFNFPILDFFKNKNGTPWQNRKYDLFYHGSLPRYHFELMMKIAEKLNSENIKNRWGIVTNDSPTITWAKKELEKRNLKSNFEFLPYIDYLRVSYYLDMAKIGIIPLPPFKKFFKNIPMKMFEFMGCGLPVVLSDLPPSRQFIKGENCAVAVEPNNIEGFVNAIKFLLHNPDKAVEMGENGKKLVFKKYNWNSEEEKLIHLYNDLIRI